MIEQRNDVTITEKDGAYVVTANEAGYYAMPNGINYFEAGEELAVVDEPGDAEVIEFRDDDPSNEEE